MSIKFEKLNLFFDRIKNIGFWQRIFGWRQIRNLSYDAYKEFNEAVNSFDLVSKSLDQIKGSTAVLNKDKEYLKEERIKLESELIGIKEKLDTAGREITVLKASTASKDETIRNYGDKINNLEREVALLKEKEGRLTKDMAQFKDENMVYKQTELDRKAKYEKDVSVLNGVRGQIQEERQKEQEERQRKEIERLELMKETWARHQESVKDAIKIICQRHTIEYVDKVPFKGTPDSTIKICEEFVIFDAKSPSSDDLENFPNYIKIQTESVKKYIKEESVRKDVFLVIPSNTVEVVEQFSYNMADYNVYVVTLDVLEPLMLSLKKIEDYEFVNQLTPEERENICRIIGKFAHMTKRRIQIDHFFAREFLGILTKCEANLPGEIIEKVIEFEKSEKLNPPQEKRNKQILIKKLKLDNEKIQKNFESLPFYDGAELD